MSRIFHPFYAWECVPAGMYNDRPPDGMTARMAIAEYSKFLRDLPRFDAAIHRVLDEWPISCEHFLTNPNINRVAWLGQASLCIETGIPSMFRRGFAILTLDERRAANELAASYLKELGAGDAGLSFRDTGNAARNVEHYVAAWRSRGYESDIPDDVPHGLARENLAPSYHALAISILSGDYALARLGFSRPDSKWYSVFKGIEIANRQEEPRPKQMEIFK